MQTVLTDIASGQERFFRNDTGGAKAGHSPAEECKHYNKKISQWFVIKRHYLHPHRV